MAQGKKTDAHKAGHARFRAGCRDRGIGRGRRHGGLCADPGGDQRPDPGSGARLRSGQAKPPMFQMESRRRRCAPASTPDKHFGYYDATANGGWEVPGEPYTNAPGSTFRWWRSRMLGGRTNHWGRHVPRFGPYDFKAKSRDGLGMDWPISYEDVAPYYDRTEKLIGVSGANAGLENHPDSSPGVLQPPSKPRVPELMIQAAAARSGHSLRAVALRDPDARHRRIPTRRARPVSMPRPAAGAAPSAPPSRPRPRCCPWRWAPASCASSPMPWCRGFVTDARGRASGVEYFDQDGGAAHFVKARAVVLAASACESARLLLNSHTARSPQGLANSSGQVGRSLMDTTGTNITGQIPALEDRPRYNEDGKDVAHLYIPFWLYKEQAAGKLDFPRAYHYEIGGRFGAPGARFRLADWKTAMALSLKEDARRYYGAHHFVHACAAR